MLGYRWCAAFWLLHAQDGCTPLIIAAKKGHMEMVRALLEGGAAVNQAGEVSGVRPNMNGLQSKWAPSTLHVLIVKFKEALS